MNLVGKTSVVSAAIIALGMSFVAMAPAQARMGGGGHGGGHFGGAHVGGGHFGGFGGGRVYSGRSVGFNRGYHGGGFGGGYYGHRCGPLRAVTGTCARFGY